MTQKISAVIVDDEPLARKGLFVRLENFPEIEIIGEASNGRDAVQMIQTLKPNLVFLDIQMPGLNGFDVLRELKEAEGPMPIVVFVTAYDQYAVKAFEVRAIDYLLKPVDEERLAQAIQRIVEYQNKPAANLQQQKLIQLVGELSGEDCEEILQHLAQGEPLGAAYPEYIAIKDSGEITRVAIDSIEWVEAAGDYMCIYTNNETHILRRTMKELEQELNPQIFQRIHRSMMVNLNLVEKLCSRQNGEYHLILTNGKELKVSRSYKDRIKQLVLGGA